MAAPATMAKNIICYMKMYVQPVDGPKIQFKRGWAQYLGRLRCVKIPFCREQRLIRTFEIWWLLWILNNAWKLARDEKREEKKACHRGGSVMAATVGVEFVLIYLH